MSYRELMSPFRSGPCMCGATDCPSCGPAQGYRKQDSDETDCAEQDVVCDMSAILDPMALWGREMSREQMHALIAAAPELLESLRLAVRQNEHDMLMTGDELRKALAAIAKATGGAQ